MSRKCTAISLLSLVLVFCVPVALADGAYTHAHSEVHLRAGPSSDYPLVISLPPN
ncbi:MAG TPA: hypothetical protein VGD63_10265 [Steroidobacteraceae bacterium]